MTQVSAMTTRTSGQPLENACMERLWRPALRRADKIRSFAARSGTRFGSPLGDLGAPDGQFGP